MEDLIPNENTQGTQTHVYNCLGLGIRKPKPLYQPFLCILDIGTAADDGDHLIYKIQGFRS